MTKPSAPRAKTPSSDDIFVTTRRFLKESHQYYLALATTLGGIFSVQTMFKKIDWSNPLLWLTPVPPLLVFLFKTVPRWWRLRRERGLVLRSRQVDAAPPPASEPLGGYFLIGPYPEDRCKDFRRADGIHEILLRWVRHAREPVLILTGSSGTGKSSLLQAYVIPQLRECTPPGTVLLLRSYEDPLAELRHELTTPGVIWDKPPANLATLDWSELLPRAVKQLRTENSEARLLVILDQFEEMVILDPQGPGSTRQAALREFIVGLRQSPLEGFTLLLSLRSDYKIFLERLGAPMLQQSINWHDVPAFRQSDAGEFLTAPATGLQIPEDRLNQILTEASAVDGTQGLIRPIILNMLGVVLRRIAGTPAAARPTHTLLADDLHRVVNDSPNHELARPILRHMLTDADTKRPCAIGDLATATGLEPHTIQGCLYDLELSGYVRPLDRPQDIRARVWEISHDFVARLLGPILKVPYRTVGQRTAGALYPVALTAWIMVIILAFLWRADQEKTKTSDAIRNLNQRFSFIATLSTNGMYYVAAPNDEGRLVDSSGLSEIALNLIKISPPVQQLSLAGCGRLENLDGLAGLGTLKNLDLSYCDALTNVDGLKGFSSLKNLDLERCDALANVDGLQGLSSLTNLVLHVCSALANVDGLQGLSSLKTLDLDSCTNLANVNGLNGLTNLQFLSLSYCDALTNVDGLKGLTKLQSLDLEQCPALANVDGLKGLAKLQSLNLFLCTNLVNVDGLKGLTNLQILDLRRCSALANVNGLKGLAKLQSLHLGGCSALANVDGLKGLTSLEKIDLTSCPNLNLNAVDHLKKSLPKAKIVYP